LKESTFSKNSSSTILQKRQQTPAFLEKLFDILENDSSYHHLISWQPDGSSFIIKKVNEFSEVVLPKYFKHSNIQSYIRQLNMYGFSKTRHDSNHHEFTHKLFQRGRRDLLPLIRRKTQGNSSSLPSSSSTVLNTPPIISLSSPITSLGNKLSQQHLQSIDFGSLQVGPGGKGLKSKKGENSVVVQRGTISPAENISGSQSISGFSSEESGDRDQGDFEDEKAEEEEERGSVWNQKHQSMNYDVSNEYSVHSRNSGFASSYSSDKLNSQPSHGQEAEDVVEEESRENIFERKVKQLEQQMRSLTEFTLNLMKKHDLLCEALQSVLQQQNNSHTDSQQLPSQSQQHYEEGMYDDLLLSRQNSQQSQHSSQQPSHSLSSFIYDSNDGKTNSEHDEASPAHQLPNSNQPSFSLFSSDGNNNDDDGPPLKRLKSFDKSIPLANVSSNNSVDESSLIDENRLVYRNSSASCSSFERNNSQHQQPIQSTALIRIPPSSVNFLEFQSDQSLQLSSFHISSISSSTVRKKRAVSLDLGGLEAIAAAAQILDDSKREGNGASTSTQRPPLHHHDRLRKSKILLPSSPSIEERVDEADYASLLLQRNKFNGSSIGGGSLTKAYSCRYNKLL
jgi:hypothetical protein